MSSSQVFRSRGAMQDAADLLGIEFGEVLLGHEVDEEVVSNLRVSVNTFTVSLSHTLSKNTRIFRVEKKVDSGELNVASLTTIVPVTCELLAFVVVRVD